MADFSLVSGFKPCGDQPRAIEELTRSISSGKRYSTLLGVTGSGKTFTLANTIANLNLPTLVISHNKTLAARMSDINPKRRFPMVSELGIHALFNPNIVMYP